MKSRRFSALCIYFLFLCGCHSNTEQEQERTIARLRQLQPAFNTSCNLVADFAETSVNGISARSQDWIDGCLRLKQALGTWKGLASVEPLSPSSQRREIVLQALAVFSNGDHVESYRLETYWHVNGSQARMYFLYLEGGGKEFGIPHLPKPSPRLDPDKRNISWLGDDVPATCAANALP